MLWIPSLWYLDFQGWIATLLEPDYSVLISSAFIVYPHGFVLQSTLAVVNHCTSVICLLPISPTSPIHYLLKANTVSHSDTLQTKSDLSNKNYGVIHADDDLV